jgi:glyoxylase-like metal-dependent hydrolase (beta-lactamase superfamily II)
MVITYQTFLVRTPRHTILIDTCAGDDKGYPAPYDFPKQPWLDNLHAAGLRLEDITHVFCTHLHFDHTGWNTILRNGRWTPTFPNAKYIFHKDEYAQLKAVSARGEVPRVSWRAPCRGTHGATIAGRSWRRDRLGSSTTRFSSTTISRSFQRLVIRHAIAAS